MLLLLLACAPIQTLRMGELPLDYSCQNGRFSVRTTGGTLAIANLASGNDPTWPGYSDAKVKMVRDFDGDSRVDALVVLVPADRNTLPMLAFVALSPDGSVVRTPPFGAWVDRLKVGEDGTIWTDAEDPDTAWRFRGGAAEPVSP